MPAADIMKQKYPRLLVGFVRLCLVTVSLALWPAAAQTAGTGTIEGRVLNTRNGEYLETARLTIEGTSLEAFTDSSGQYRFTNVPAGPARVRVFFTGLDVQTETVLVAAGATVQHDVSLAAVQKRQEADKDSGTVKLSQFVVGASKEMDGAAIAINEQRFASNIVNVVSADEFGQVAEGNVGEFLKFIPGISIDYGGGDARTISMGGVPSNNVPVTIGGFSLSSAASSGTGRTVELEQVSINNIARIEVYQSPTPESPGSALAAGVQRQRLFHDARRRKEPAQDARSDPRRHLQDSSGLRFFLRRAGQQALRFHGVRRQLVAIHDAG